MAIKLSLTAKNRKICPVSFYKAQIGLIAMSSMVYYTWHIQMEHHQTYFKFSGLYDSI